MSILKATFAVRSILRRPYGRVIHTSSTCLAKKQSSSDASEDDLFGESDEGDLFPLNAAESEASKTPAAAGTTPKPVPTRKAKLEPTRPERPKLPPAVRAEKFAELMAFTTPRANATGDARRQFKHPPYLRESAFPRLMQLAATVEQLEQAVELLPGLVTNCGFKYPAQTVEEFARRCDSLGCPQLALKVFGDVPRYQLKLTRVAAQQLMHSLYRFRMLEQTITVAALYDVHSLGGVERDIVASSILAAASVRGGNKALETTLLTEIRNMLGYSVGGVRVAQPWKDRKQLPDKWVKSYLRHADTMIEKRDGHPVKWLRAWRHRSIPSPAAATATA